MWVWFSLRGGRQEKAEKWGQVVSVGDEELGFQPRGVKEEQSETCLSLTVGGGGEKSKGRGCT